ncbi:MAG: hypothetical protein NUV55_00035 [Sulfuricaulis sp.]|uniref:hypothetical protein n=1 Tax=Sulfuricaulis sp. TaxID=2003553 RepID=UPI0025F6E4D6|nr:hypothetical protein [Sulfuricaulis sp.]MCR4345586.1 hypothetical protein [Sulfuricaulis sp.]
MNTSRRTMMKLFSGMAAGLAVSRSVYALNPQPEVPSKQAQDGQTKPKALNPQPEVPSKSGNSRQQPRALNPQPEVPSKSKKKQRRARKKPKAQQ